MAELPVTKLQLIVIIKLGGESLVLCRFNFRSHFYIRERREKLLGKWVAFNCCGSCWSHCRRRDGDGGEKDSSKGTSYCYVNPETQTSNQTIRNISASKYPEPARRYLEEKATMYVKQLEEYRRVLQKGILPSAWNLYIRWYP